MTFSYKKDIIKSKGYKKVNQSKTCMACGKYTRSFRRYKNQFLCYDCYRKKVKMIYIGNGLNGYTLNQAVNKVYEVKGYTTKKGYKRTKQISFPKCMIGKKFKITLIENETKNNEPNKKK